MTPPKPTRRPAKVPVKVRRAMKAIRKERSQAARQWQITQDSVFSGMWTGLGRALAILRDEFQAGGKR